MTYRTNNKQIASARLPRLKASQRWPRNDSMKPGFVYILTNKNNTTLYTGVTANLVQRLKQHQDKNDQKSFTARYNLNKLVYYETFQMIGDAIAREKQIKAGSRAKKIKLIESINPNWDDLTNVTKCHYEDIGRSNLMT